jgi:transcriptional regulator with XRE-family HTH domain
MSNRAWDWKTIKGQLEDQGWRLECNDGRHVRCYPPDKSKSIVLGTINSSDRRAIKCFVRDLKKNGFDPDMHPRSTRHKPVTPAATLGEALAAKGTPLPKPLTWGKALRKARKADGLHVFEVAELVGTKNATVKDWEADKVAPSDMRYAKLLSLFPDLANVDPPMGRTYSTTTPEDTEPEYVAPPVVEQRRVPPPPSTPTPINVPPPAPKPTPVVRLVPTNVNKLRVPQDKDTGINKVIGAMPDLKPTVVKRASSHKVYEHSLKLADQLFEPGHALRLGREGDVWLVAAQLGDTTSALGQGETLAHAAQSLLKQLKAQVEKRRAELAALIEETP